jgi:nitrogen fixation protein FixH
MVLAMLIGFFGLVIAVNLVMVRAALSTFGGVDTPSSYQAGLHFRPRRPPLAGSGRAPLAGRRAAGFPPRAARQSR